MTESDYFTQKLNQEQFNECLLQEQRLGVEVQKADLNLIVTLGLKPQKDGNMYCFVWGKDLQEGIAGFGSTIMNAIYDFNKNFYSTKP